MHVKHVALAIAISFYFMNTFSTLAGVRIKDITTLRGVRENQLLGYGIVVGLQGSGDTLRNSVFTEQSLQSMLEHLGVNVNGASLRTRNVAAVIVTAEVPAFVREGARIDVTVSSMGDATSLMGGTLILTPLKGADGIIYAAAQGSVTATGFNATGQAETVTQGTATTARIPEGAIIEHDVPGSYENLDNLSLALRNADFKTAIKITDAINDFTRQRYGAELAHEFNLGQVSLRKPTKTSITRFIAEIGDLQIEPDVPARVVIDSKTGTVVVGADVQISTVAITHGSLTVRVSEAPEVSQPLPRSNGKTVVVPRTSIGIDQPDAKVAIVSGANLRSLVNGMNRIGVKPSDMITIIQSIKAAGALQADLIIQ